MLIIRSRGTLSSVRHFGGQNKFRKCSLALIHKMSSISPRCKNNHIRKKEVNSIFNSDLPFLNVNNSIRIFNADFTNGRLYRPGHHRTGDNGRQDSSRVKNLFIEGKLIVEKRKIRVNTSEMKFTNTFNHM